MEPEHHDPRKMVISGSHLRAIETCARVTAPGETETTLARLDWHTKSVLEKREPAGEKGAEVNFTGWARFAGLSPCMLRRRGSGSCSLSARSTRAVKFLASSRMCSNAAKSSLLRKIGSLALERFKT